MLAIVVFDMELFMYLSEMVPSYPMMCRLMLMKGFTLYSSTAYT